MPNWSKIIEAKVALARRGAKASRQGDNSRVPPGQKQVHDFPVLDLGNAPFVSTDEWRLKLCGLVENALELDWRAFSALPQIDVVIDFHCVTRWSQLDMPWRGVGRSRDRWPLRTRVECPRSGSVRRVAPRCHRSSGHPGAARAG